MKIGPLPLAAFSLIVGSAIMALAYAHVVPGGDDGSAWPEEIGPEWDGEIVIDNHLSVAQRAEMQDVMNKLPKFARQHVMITDEEGNAFCNLAADPCEITVAFTYHLR